MLSEVFQDSEWDLGFLVTAMEASLVMDMDTEAFRGMDMDMEAFMADILSTIITMDSITISGEKL